MTPRTDDRMGPPVTHHALCTACRCSGEGGGALVHTMPSAGIVVREVLEVFQNWILKVLMFICKLKTHCLFTV